MSPTRLQPPQPFAFTVISPKDETIAIEFFAVPRFAAEHIGVIRIDWGDGVLYDRSRVWAEQQQMVASGLLRPEIALAWYYDLPAETEADLQAVREKYMPAAKGGEKHE